MAVKERNQQLLCNDTAILRLYEYNGDTAASVNAISKVEIYKLDHHDRQLIQTVTSVTVDGIGQYSIQVPLPSPLYTIGKYIDLWYINFTEDQCPGTRSFEFEIGPDQWYANSDAFLWEFAFSFRPIKFRKNERKNIVVEVTPNVPHISDLERYYAALASFPNLFISIEMRCGDCIPQEHDLRLVVDRAPVLMTSNRLGRYFLDTTELECGIYDVWFELDLGGNTYLSPRNQLQIYN